MAATKAVGVSRGQGSSLTRDPMLFVLFGCALLGLVSVFGAGNQIQAADEGAIALGVTGVAAALLLFRRPDALVPRTRLGWVWIAFAGWALLSALISGRIWLALMGELSSLLGWFAIASLALIVVAAWSRGDETRRIMSVVAPVVMFAQTAAALVQHLQGLAPRGTLPNTSYLGQVFVLLLPFVVEGDESVIPLSRSARHTLVAASILVLAAGASRAALLVTLAWGLWLFLKRSPWKPAYTRAAVAGVIILVIAFAAVSRPKEVLGSFELDTLGGREKMWHAAALAVAQRPLFGFGPDGFLPGAVSVTTPELARRAGVINFDKTYAVDPHALPVWMVVSTGVVGLALFLWGLFEIGLGWLRARRGSVDLAAPSWALAGAFVVFCTAPVALQVIPLLGLVVGVAIAPAVGVGGHGAKPSDDEAALGASRFGARRFAGYALLAGCGVAALLFAANGATRLPLENHSPQLSSALAPRAQASSDLWRVDPHLAHLASLHWGWAAQGDRSVAATQPDLAAIRRALALDSRNPFIALEHARTLRFYGAPTADIEAAFLEAIRRWPLYPRARAEYAVLLAQTGRPDEAREQIAIAELVDDDDPERLAALKAASDVLGEGP